MIKLNFLLLLDPVSNTLGQKIFSIWKDLVCTSDLGNVSICFCFSMGHYLCSSKKKEMEIAITFSANEGLGDPSD